MKGYNSSRGVYPERSQKSLTTPWDYIKECCTKFSEFYSSVLRLNPSGMSDADKVLDMLLNFCTVAFMDNMDLDFTYIQISNLYN
jgi:hypothetical protein